MKLNHKDALSILGMSISDIDDDREIREVTRSLIKTMYRQACSKYHPDRNPAGLEMMKLVNAAAESLAGIINGEVLNWDWSIEKEAETPQMGDELNAALNAVVGLGLTIEICGSWIWVSGDTKPHKDILKSAGYRWAPKKLMWSFCGGARTTSRGKFSMDDIRNRHGSFTVKPRDSKRIAA